jgi:taurine dioxygenase
MKSQPISPMIGVEVRGMTIDDTLSDDAIGSLRDLLLRHGVVVFRDLPPVCPEAHIAFAERFGSLEPFPGDPVHGRIVRIVHGPDSPPTENVWHTDMSYRMDPPLGSLLKAVELPPAGGDTIFANMREIWKRLPDAVQALVRHRSAQHDIAKLAAPSIADELRAAAPPTSQPAVRIHPETHDELLYVNPAYTTAFDDLTPADSSALLDYLFRQVTVPEYQCRVRWDTGTMVFWDNRAVQHYAVGDYFPNTRIMERVTLRGDQPYGPSAAVAA